VVRKKKKSRTKTGGKSPFIIFGDRCTIIFLLLFLAYYIILMICILPVLRVTSPIDVDGNGIPDDILQGARGREKARHAVQMVKNTMDRMKFLDNIKHKTKKREGFMVLGMHRSGTSMLAGLMVNGMGYITGGPLIGAASDNEKGFFERVDIVNQNDEFFRLQRMDWASNVVHYDWEKALAHKESGEATFKEGERGLAFLNDSNNAPWLQKDPRMCIALRTWVELLDVEPAIVFTYRHPLEVAMSLQKRNPGFHAERGLRLWIVYNMRAIENSAGLCRVLSNNDDVMANPTKEVQRISDELTKKCGVPRPPHRLSEDVVKQFIDSTLHHNKKADDKKGKVLATFKNGCVAKDFKSIFLEGTQNRNTELDMYLKAMKVYCDLKSGDAYHEGYEWPSLTFGSN